MAPVVTTISIILCTNKIQNADIMVAANRGPPGKMAVKMRRGVFLANLQASTDN